MCSMLHDFHLVSQEDMAQNECMRRIVVPGGMNTYECFRYINASGSIQLHDDFIFYIHDTLEWIPTINPDGNEKQNGLNHYGITIIDYSGAAIAKSIFSSWAKLFSTGPETITLTGGWECEYGKPMEEGKYSKVQIDRNEMVTTLNALVDYTDNIMETNGQYYILNLGI